MEEKIEVDIRVPNQTRYLCLIGHIGENIALTLKHFGGDREKLRGREEPVHLPGQRGPG